MKFLSIEQRGYIPYTHMGTSYLKAEFGKPCSAILSNNGFGKSSLLRALTPYPEVRSSYLKNGYCIKTIAHNGHTFVLTSDFKNTTKAHSFQMDGKELNQSGSTETQRELVEEYFGYNQVIDTLMAGNYFMCNMTPAERKQLLMATYPSDLSFMLEYHKKVRSQIRIYNTNLKMLRDREHTIRGRLLDKSHLEEICTIQKDLMNFSSDIDKLVLLIEQDKHRTLNDPALSHTYSKRSVEELEAESRTIVTTANALKRMYPDLFTGTPEERSAQYHVAGERITRITEEMERDKETIMEIRETLSEYERYKDLNIDQEMDTLKKKVSQLSSEIEKIHIDPSVPLLADQVVGRADWDQQRVRELCADLHAWSGKLLSPSDVNRMETDLQVYRRQLQNLHSNLTGVEEQIKQLEGRQLQESRYRYPVDCNLVCNLKASVDKMLKRTADELSKVREHEASLKKEINQIETEISRLENAIEIPRSALPKIEAIQSIIQGYACINWLLNDLVIYECLNADPFMIPNRLLKAIENTKLDKQLKTYQDELSTSRVKLGALETAQAAAKELKLISKTIYDKQTKLSQLIKQYRTNEQLIQKLTSDRTVLKEMESLASKVEMLQHDAQENSIARWKRARIDFDDMLLQQFDELKRLAMSKLASIDITIREQESLLTRLNDEVLPNIKEIQTELKDWVAVEEGLSPSTGLPHIHMVCYINKLITRVNEYLKRVWCYDMELMYLEEDKPLDYTIRVLINRNSTVADLSILSDGQKAMVSLAFTLAIATERGYADQYPIKMDEVDPALGETHRIKLTSMVSDMVLDKTIHQLFLVNHFVVHTGMSDCEVICFSTEGIVAPAVFNERAVIS